MAAATSKTHFHHTHDTSAAQQQRKHPRPRPITESERAVLEPFLEKVHYSPRYFPSRTADTDVRYADDDFEYR